MGLKADLITEVKSTLSTQWNEQVTKTVPAAEDLLLNSNHAKNIESATVLYADLDGSTNMVDTNDWCFAAEIYKIYLRSAAQIIKSENGTITAYDGDRIMAVFVGDTKNTKAVRAALKINYAVEQILRPAIKNQYPNSAFILNHSIGIDTSQLHASRIGVRGDNDIVWVGKAANHAAKLSNLTGKPIWITKAVHDVMHDEVKVYNRVSMWEKRRWTQMNNAEVYCTTYYYSFT